MNNHLVIVTSRNYIIFIAAITGLELIPCHTTTLVRIAFVNGIWWITMLVLCLCIECIWIICNVVIVYIIILLNELRGTFSHELHTLVMIIYLLPGGLWCLLDWHDCHFATAGVHWHSLQQYTLDARCVLCGILICIDDKVSLSTLNYVYSLTKYTYQYIYLCLSCVWLYTLLGSSVSIFSRISQLDIFEEAALTTLYVGVSVPKPWLYVQCMQTDTWTI